MVFYTVYVLESFTPTSCLREQFYFQGVDRERHCNKGSPSWCPGGWGECFVLWILSECSEKQSLEVGVVCPVVHGTRFGSVRCYVSGSGFLEQLGGPFLLGINRRLWKNLSIASCLSWPFPLACNNSIYCLWFLPFCLDAAWLASVRHLDLNGAGSWISLIWVLVLAALAAPDSRQLDVLEVLRVFEGWERMGRICVRAKNRLLLLLF